MNIDGESPLEILAKMVVNGGTVEANKGRAPSLASRQSVVAARPLKRGGSAGNPRLPIENGASTELARISHACTPQLDSFISSSLLFLTAIFKTCQMWW